MKVKKYLELVAYKTDMEICGESTEVYKSKFDDSYMTHVGMEDSVKYLADREITEQLTHGVGFSPKDKKWYGWSHRAIYGFEIGSTCKKGDCHYTANNPEEMIDDHARFFTDISEECGQQHREECQILPDRSGIRILPAPIVIPMANSFDELADHLDSDIDLPEVDIQKDNFYEVKCGKGVWTAKTLEDAKQMAVDFNEGVS